MLEDLVDALATYRLTRLLVEDRILQPVRDRVMDRHGPTTQLGYFVTCPWCVSMWVGAGVVAARKVAPRLWPLASRTLALSATSGALATQFG